MLSFLFIFGCVQTKTTSTCLSLGAKKKKRGDGWKPKEPDPRPLIHCLPFAFGRAPGLPAFLLPPSFFFYLLNTTPPPPARAPLMLAAAASTVAGRRAWHAARRALATGAPKPGGGVQGTPYDQLTIGQGEERARGGGKK